MYIVHILSMDICLCVCTIVQSAYMQHYRAGKLRDNVSEMSLHKLTVNLAIRIPSQFELLK